MKSYALISNIRNLSLVLVIALCSILSCKAYTKFLWVNTDSVFQVDNLYYRFLSCQYELSNPVRQIDSVQVFVASPPDGVAYGLDDYVVRPSITFNGKEYNVRYIDTCAFADSHIRSIRIPAMGLHTEILDRAFLNATIDERLTLGENGRLIFLTDSVFCDAEIGELTICGTMLNRYITNPDFWNEREGFERASHFFDNAIIHHLDCTATDRIDGINNCTIDKITFGSRLKRILNCFNNCMLPSRITIGPSILELGESFSNSSGFNEFVVEDSNNALAGIFGYEEANRGHSDLDPGIWLLLLLEKGYGLEHSSITKLYIGRDLCKNVTDLRYLASNHQEEYWNGEIVDDINNIPFGPNMFDNVEELEFGRKGMMEPTLPTHASVFPFRYDTIYFYTIHQATHLKKVIVHETDTVRNAVGLSSLDRFGAVFSEAQYAGATLCVPKGYADAYCNHALWGKFANIVEYVDYSYADLDINGIVDIADVNIVINAMLGKGSLEPSTPPNEMERSDVTGDGQIDISDVNAIIGAMLGKE